MRKLIMFVSSIAMVVSTTGCGMVARDLRHPGGYPGRLLDERSFVASHNKQLQLLRFTIIMAMAARMSEVTTQSAKEADAVASYMAMVADELNFAAANIYPINGKPPCMIGSFIDPLSSLYRMPDSSDAGGQATAEKIDFLKEVEKIAQEAAGHASTAQSAAGIAQKFAENAEARAVVARSAADAAQAASEAARLAAERALLAATDPTAAAAAAPLAVLSAPTANPIAPSPTCNGYYVNFEADVPLIEVKMMRLLLATLPQESVQKFAKDIHKGNFLGSIWSGLKVTLTGIGGLHTAFGAYRSGQEVIVANKPQCSRLLNDDEHSKARNQENWTMIAVVQCLGLQPSQIFVEHPDERKGAQMPEVIHEDSFKALMALAYTSCARLPVLDSSIIGKDRETAEQQRNNNCSRLKWNPTARF